MWSTWIALLLLDLRGANPRETSGSVPLRNQMREIPPVPTLSGRETTETHRCRRANSQFVSLISRKVRSCVPSSVPGNSLRACWIRPGSHLLRFNKSLDIGQVRRHCGFVHHRGVSNRKWKGNRSRNQTWLQGWNSTDESGPRRSFFSSSLKS